MNLGFLINKVYADAVCNGSAICNPLGPSNINDFGTLIQCIITYFTNYIAPTIAVIFVLYGAFQMLTSAGEPEKFSAGRKTVLYTIIGYAVIIIAAGLIDVTLTSLGGVKVTPSCPMVF